MVAVHKISGDFYEDVFALIALHSSLEDYAMVYAINRHIKSNFKRFSKDLDVSEYASFPFFEWKDEINGRYWTLIPNNSLKVEYSENKNLFKDEPSFIAHHLVPEHKDVDYFLKIDQNEEEEEEIEEIVKALFAIPKVLTAYSIDVKKLKSKNNLIF
ncbi:MAG: hypothetical protein COC08_00900 [Maribacter sp.]|nr:MAG: hypothetical protein COC08_00900 [Maribacter sp.]